MTIVKFTKHFSLGGQTLLLYNIIQLILLITGIVHHIFFGLSTWPSIGLCIHLSCSNKQKGSMRKSNPAANLFISSYFSVTWHGKQRRREGRKALFLPFEGLPLKMNGPDSLKRRLGLGLSPGRRWAEPDLNGSKLNIYSSPFLSILGVSGKEHMRSASPRWLKV